MWQNFFQLNKEKTGIIVFGNKDKHPKIIAHLLLTRLKSADQVGNLGFIYVSELNL